MLFSVFVFASSLIKSVSAKNSDFPGS